MRSTINSYLDDYLKRGAETAFANRRGLRHERWSYRRVAETAFRFARELDARGIGKGERVVVWAANSAEWVAAFFGCALCGGVVVPLDVESAADFVVRVQRQTEARLLLLSAETKKRADALDVPTLMLEELDETVSLHSSERFESREISDGDLVEIIYTSGTTAEPRGVCLTHRNLLANLAPLEEEIQKYLRWERLVHPIRFLCLLPLSHVFGQFMGFLVPQLLCGEVFFQDSLNPSEIVHAIKSQRISVVVTVPRLLESLREHVERRESARGRVEDLKRRLAAVEGAARRLEDGGWLRTGDLGEVDDEGNIFFKGRKKDVIVTAAGLNIYPEDIEAALNRQPEVKESAVVGVEGPRGPEPLAVLIMRDPEADPSRSIERANRDLARHQHVRRWHVWPETDFPRTPTQKVRKRDILDALTAENSDAGVRARRARNSSDNGAGSTPSDPVASVITSLTSPAGGEVAHLNPSAKLSTDL